jgi:hypothetical protein
LEILGANINNNSGGLVYNDGGYSGLKVELYNCSAKIFGKVRENAGPLIGYIQLNSDNVYIIDNCFSMVVDDDEDPSINITLGSGAGAFVGSGISNTVTISNSYCIFNGSMSYGSGIIGGKFLGSSGPLSISKFNAITNITYLNGGNGASEKAYNLSSYFGAGNTYTSLNLSKVYFLHLGLNNSSGKLADTVEIVSPFEYNVVQDLSGLNKYTDYSSFNSIANLTDNRIGSKQYIVTVNETSNTFYSFDSNQVIDYQLNTTTNILKGVSKFSNFDDITTIYSPTPYLITLPTVIFGNGIVSGPIVSDTSIATYSASPSKINMLKAGQVTISMSITETHYYAGTTTTSIFTIYNLPSKITDSLNINNINVKSYLKNEMTNLFVVFLTTNENNLSQEELLRFNQTICKLSNRT